MISSQPEAAGGREAGRKIGVFGGKTTVGSSPSFPSAIYGRQIRQGIWKSFRVVSFCRQSSGDMSALRKRHHCLVRKPTSPRMKKALLYLFVSMATVPLHAGVYAHWSFDSDLTDSSPNKRHGTLVD